MRQKWFGSRQKIARELGRTAPRNEARMVLGQDRMVLGQDRMVLGQDRMVLIGMREKWP